VSAGPSGGGKQRLESHLTPITIKVEDSSKDFSSDAVLTQPNIFMSYFAETSKSDANQLASS